MGTDLEWDLARLLEVYRLAHAEQRRLGIDELWLTADTNEMCDTPQYMVELLVRLREENRAAFDSLLYVEQTCERDLRKRMLDMAELREVKPVILDDALSSLEDLELALELGYSGLALKTCKCQSTELVLAPRAGRGRLRLELTRFRPRASALPWPPPAARTTKSCACDREERVAREGNCPLLPRAGGTDRRRGVSAHLPSGAGLPSPARCHGLPADPGDAVGAGRQVVGGSDDRFRQV